MIPFDLAEPTSLSEAIKLLNPDDPTIRPIAGGTALMLMMKAGVFSPEKLVSLRKIESKYSSVIADASGLKIGAMTTLATLERSADVKKITPLITRTTLTLSNTASTATRRSSPGAWMGDASAPSTPARIACSFSGMPSFS